MIIPSQITDSFVPIAAGIVVSLVSKYILNKPRIDACCRPATEEEPDCEGEDTSKTEMSDAFSRASAITTSTLTPPHPIGYHRNHY